MSIENKKRKEDLTLFLSLFIRDNFKYGFEQKKLDDYITKYVEATSKVKVKQFNKLLDDFEKSISDLHDIRTLEDKKLDDSFRPYRFEQFIFNQNELKEAILERKKWLVKKRMGIRNYMSK